MRMVFSKSEESTNRGHASGSLHSLGRSQTQDQNSSAQGCTESMNCDERMMVGCVKVVKRMECVFVYFD